ncbi:hypothetical protein Tco_0242196 [Tanacetum coccineum]
MVCSSLLLARCLLLFVFDSLNYLARVSLDRDLADLGLSCYKTNRLYESITRVILDQNQVIPINFLTGLNEADTISIDVADESFDVRVTRIAIGVTAYRYEYHLNRTWNRIVNILQLQPGTYVVFTKKSDRRFDLMGFNDETVSNIIPSCFIGITNLNELQPALSYEQEAKKPSHELRAVKLITADKRKHLIQKPELFHIPLLSFVQVTGYDLDVLFCV